jgi:protein translocase SecG subunit
MAFFISSVLPIIQIALAVVLTGAILLQRSEAGLGSSFGGDGFSAGFSERRGFEKALFYGTIVIAALFAISALVTLLASNLI